MAYFLRCLNLSKVCSSLLKKSKFEQHLFLEMDKKGIVYYGKYC